MRFSPSRSVLLAPTALLLGLACSAGEGSDLPPGDDTSQAGQGGSLGGSAGASSGAGNMSSGGNGGQGGVTATGGTNQTGGSSGTGAAGMASGTGGDLGTGGDSTGGIPSGGVQNGGQGGAGGAPGGTGASAGGGKGGTGGKGGVGGAGASSGAGGKGGKGGAGSGGSGGSTPGLGPWTNGYVATMYGEINSGDCTAYSSNFTDHTPIDTFTCVRGTGARKVTLSAYASGVANNSSYYAAFGDLSSLWTVNGNASACTCSGSTSMTCGGPQCASEISSTGSCGVCVAVKCDPNSTFRDSMNYSHNSNCNSTSYVVVQNIDACPHNHTTNVSSATGWCTDRQAQHIDLSCSGLGDISNLGTRVGQAGWLPVSVQVVDCSIGLGRHAL